MAPFRVLQAGRVEVDSRLRDDTQLWRYVDLPKFIDFLQNGRLYLSRGDQFLDKYEGQFTIPLREKIEAFYSQHPEYEFTYDDFRRTIREKVFISCWHESSVESMAMWSIYGRSGAVALRSNVGLLSSALAAAHSRYLLSIEKVDYIEYGETDDFDISPYSRVFAYKRRAYAYEQEVRLMIDKSLAEFSTPTSERGIYLPMNGNSALSEIVVSPESPGWFFDMVLNLTQRYCLNVPVSKSALTIDVV